MIIGKDIVLPNDIKAGQVSDGYHTFDELYEFRKQYNAALFNEWAKQNKFYVHKSKRHNDGEECFGGGWFIVIAKLPYGQISNHYEMKDWELFKIPEENTAMLNYDGHTGLDVLDRLSRFNRSTKMIRYSESQGEQ